MDKEELMKCLKDDLDHIYSLEDGWDSYNAEKPKPEVIEIAKDYMNIGIKEFGIYPRAIRASVEGGVGLIYCIDKEHKYYADLEFYNHNSVEDYELDWYIENNIWPIGCAIVTSKPGNFMTTWRILDTEHSTMTSLKTMKEFLENKEDPASHLEFAHSLKIYHTQEEIDKNCKE